MNANGMARGPKNAPINPQKTGLAPRSLAILWQARMDARSTSTTTSIKVIDPVVVFCDCATVDSSTRRRAAELPVIGRRAGRGLPDVRRYRPTMRGGTQRYRPADMRSMDIES
jgi:hypothetical protein